MPDRNSDDTSVNFDASEANCAAYASAPTFVAR
ncbi:Uncharacterised protein [Mycobacteroides abscessus subsp. abscessus]|nr:Uncharacterised protein [Mycobacteroides abscessus subsp. abscessus]